MGWRMAPGLTLRPAIVAAVLSETVPLISTLSSGVGMRFSSQVVGSVQFPPAEIVWSVSAWSDKV